MTKDTLEVKSKMGWLNQISFTVIIFSVIIFAKAVSLGGYLEVAGHLCTGESAGE